MPQECKVMPQERKVKPQECKVMPQERQVKPQECKVFDFSNSYILTLATDIKVCIFPNK